MAVFPNTPPASMLRPTPIAPWPPPVSRLAAKSSSLQSSPHTGQPVLQSATGDGGQLWTPARPQHFPASLNQAHTSMALATSSFPGRLEESMTTAQH